MVARTLADLRIAIGTDNRQALAALGKLEAELDGIEKAFSRATASVDKRLANLDAGFNRVGRSLKTAFAGIVTGVFVREMTQVNAEFQKLMASLETVTGSASGASAAFDQIRTFATQTPFSVRQVTEAFIKLKALGLDPSMDSLRSYGNTASAMGKDLMQLIEAVADASTGEFERLKEFGIKAKQEGDQVALTFQGVTTVVGKNAQEIQDYLRGIGETRFAGAMDRQMKTLGGALSNLGDAWESLLYKIGEAGAADGIMAVVSAITDLLSNEQGIKDIGAAFKGIGEAIAWTITQLAELVGWMGRIVEGPTSIKDLQAKIAELSDYVGDPIAAASLKLYSDRLSAITDRMRMSRESGGTLPLAKAVDTVSTSTSKAAGKADSYIAKLQRQLDAMDETARQTAVMNGLLSAGVDTTDLMVTATGDLVGSYTAEAEEIARLIRAIEDKTAARELEKAAVADTLEMQERARDAAREYAAEIERVAEDVATTWTDVLIQAGDDGFQGLLDGVKNWGRAIALEVAKQRFVIPITAQIVAAVPTLFGVSGAGGAGASGLGGGWISSGVDDIASWVGTQLGFSGGGSGAAPLVGRDGRLTGGGVTAAGPSYWGSLGGVSGFLGNAGMGAGIGTLMQSLGIGNSQGYGSTIGGGIGGLLGTLATPWLGPAGPILGGVLGGLVGGLFGPKPSNNTASMHTNFRTGVSGRDDDKASQENITITEAIGQELANLNTLITQLTGGPAQADLSWWLGDRDGTWLYNNITGEKQGFGKKSETSVENLTLAASRILVESLTDVSAEMKDAMLRSLDLRDSMEEVGKDFQVLDLLFGEQEETLSDTEAAIKSLNEQFDEAAKRAGELGLSVADVEAKRQEALETMRTSFLDAVEADIKQLEDPMGAALDALQKTYEQALKDAEALGVDTTLIERRYGLQRQQIIEQFAQGTIDSLEAYLREITYGATSGVNPEATLAGTRQAFEAAAALAMSGDTAAKGDIQALAQAFLEASRGYNASSSAYASDVARVQEVVRAILGEVPAYADGTGFHPGGLALVGEAGPELIRAPRGAQVIPFGAMYRDRDGMDTGALRGLIRQGLEGNGLLRGLVDGQQEMVGLLRKQASRIARLEAGLPQQAVVGL